MGEREKTIKKIHQRVGALCVTVYFTCLPTQQTQWQLTFSTVNIRYKSHKVFLSSVFSLSSLFNSVNWNYKQYCNSIGKTFVHFLRLLTRRQQKQQQFSLHSNKPDDRPIFLCQCESSIKLQLLSTYILKRMRQKSQITTAHAYFATLPGRLFSLVLPFFSSFSLFFLLRAQLCVWDLRTLCIGKCETIRVK